jgi:hypothetical protein
LLGAHLRALCAGLLGLSVANGVLPIDARIRAWQASLLSCIRQCRI